MTARRLVELSLMLSLGACFVPPVERAGLKCDADHPCPNGNECLQGFCRLPGTDGCAPGTTRACGSASSRGECRIGHQQCDDDGNFRPCEGAVVPLAEQCDGLDNDCDGEVDEESGVGCPMAQGVCIGAKVACVNGHTPSGCTPADYFRHSSNYQVEELSCDRLDNDCDGAVDEEVPVGTCAACGLDQLMSTCGGAFSCTGTADGGTRPVGAETCDLVDNDCNGSIDEGVVDDSTKCDNVFGVCATKPRACVNGRFEPADQCSVASFGSLFDGANEVRCDGLDNDCDGQTDEELDGGRCNLPGVCVGLWRACIADAGPVAFDDWSCLATASQGRPVGTPQTFYVDGYWPADSFCNQQPGSDDDNDCNGESKTSMRFTVATNVRATAAYDDELAVVWTGSAYQLAYISRANGDLLLATVGGDLKPRTPQVIATGAVAQPYLVALDFEPVSEQYVLAWAERSGAATKIRMRRAQSQADGGMSWLDSNTASVTLTNDVAKLRVAMHPSRQVVAGWREAGTLGSLALSAWRLDGGLLSASPVPVNVRTGSGLLPDGGSPAVDFDLARVNDVTDQIAVAAVDPAQTGTLRIARVTVASSVSVNVMPVFPPFASERLDHVQISTSFSSGDYVLAAGVDPTGRNAATRVYELINFTLNEHPSSPLPSQGAASLSSTVAELAGNDGLRWVTVDESGASSLARTRRLGPSPPVAVPAANPMPGLTDRVRSAILLSAPYVGLPINFDGGALPLEANAVFMLVETGAQYDVRAAYLCLDN